VKGEYNSVYTESVINGCMCCAVRSNDDSGTIGVGMPSPCPSVFILSLTNHCTSKYLMQTVRYCISPDWMRPLHNLLAAFPLNVRKPLISLTFISLRRLTSVVCIYEFTTRYFPYNISSCFLRPLSERNPARGLAVNVGQDGAEFC
jgi:hypothetical protein